METKLPYLIRNINVRSHQYLLVVFVLLGSLAGCHNTEPISEWEQQWNGKVLAIVKKSPPSPFLYADSATILNLEYNHLQHYKTQAIQHHIDSLTTIHQQALLELETISNSALKKAYQSQINNIAGRINAQKALLLYYSNQANFTQLTLIKQRANFYAQQAQTLIGYSQQVTFTLQQGLLPAVTVTKTYLLSPDKTKVLGELTAQNQ